MCDRISDERLEAICKRAISLYDGCWHEMTCLEAEQMVIELRSYREGYNPKEHEIPEGVPVIVLGGAEVKDGGEWWDIMERHHLQMSSARPYFRAWTPMSAVRRWWPLPIGGHDGDK